MEHRQTGVRDRRKLNYMFRFLAVLAGLNLVWEIIQLPFYTLWQHASWYETFYAIAHCSAGDVLISIACAIAALAITRWRWPTPGRQSTLFLLCFISLSVAYTIFSEWLNTAVRISWAYSDLMPVLPLLGTGVAPLLQWITLPILALWLNSLTSKLSKAGQ